MTACGKTTNYNTDSDPSLCLKLVESAQKMDLPVRVGNTVGTDDFYEAQGRLDGTFCTISEVDKMNWLEELRRDHSIINFEMEAPLFLSFTRRANIPAAVICAAMLNRLNGDQITTPKDKMYEFIDNVLKLGIQYVKDRVAQDDQFTFEKIGN